MRVFVSWSGDASRVFADSFVRWLRQVVQTADPWMSTEIDKGRRWTPEIEAGLAGAKIGVIILTPENLESPWLHFEAGAISKTPDAQPCTFLLGVAPGDISQPLAQFQHTTFAKQDVQKLIVTINSAVRKNGTKTIDDKDLEQVFDRNWSDLESAGKLAMDAMSVREPIRAERSSNDMLEEIIGTSREILRRLDQSLVSPLSGGGLGAAIAKMQARSDLNALSSGSLVSLEDFALKNALQRYVSNTESHDGQLSAMAKAIYEGALQPAPSTVAPESQDASGVLSPSGGPPKGTRRPK